MKSSFENFGNSWGEGGSSKTPWNGKSWGVGGANQRVFRGGGMDIFWNQTLKVSYCKIVKISPSEYMLLKKVFDK